MKNTEKTELRQIAVFLGSAKPSVMVYRQAVMDFAEYLAGHDMTLIFGGSNAGMMKLLADTMLRRNGRVIGVFCKCLSARLIRNDLTEAIFTDSLAERKEEMLKRADAVVALPGSIGTFDELFDTLAQRKLRTVTCPVGVLNVNGFFDPVFELLRNSREAGFSSAETVALLQSGKTPEELFGKLEKQSAG
jgi:hypothetical protein